MHATFSLMSLSVLGIFAMCKWCLYILCVVIFVGALMEGIAGVGYIPIAFFAWFLARMFRIAMFEIEKLKDGNLLITIFSVSISLVALAISILTLVISIRQS